MFDAPIDIIIIGAGLSGLSCARELSAYREQVNVVLLEGSDRIGGRVRSITANDGTILQLGAECIHGTEGNALYDFIVEKSLTSCEINTNIKPSDCVFCFPKELASVCSQNKIRNAVDKATNYLEQFQKELCLLTEAEISKYESVGAFMVHCFTRTLDEYCEDVDVFNIIKSVFMTWIGYERISSGCTSVFDLDIRGFLNWIDLDGDPFISLSDCCQNGFEDVVTAIVKDISNDSIQINCEVNRIEEIMVDGRSRLKVRCCDGKEFEADTVVITVSLGVLKQFLKNNVFAVELPETKYSAITKLSYGNLIKIFFKFLTPIDGNVSYFNFYPSPKRYDFSNFDKENHLFAFERVGTSDWWLSWLVCEEGFQITNPVSYIDNLILSFSETYPKFSSNSVDEKSIIISDWYNDKFFRGSYTYQKPGTDGHDITNLANPVSYGGAYLLFAGEATSKHYFSSTHGAYMSGIREAENIKSIYRLTGK